MLRNVELTRGGVSVTAAALLAATILMPGVTHAQDKAKAVTVVLSEEPDNLDGCGNTKSNNGRVIFNNAVEGLTQIDYKTGTLVPRLALSWEQTSPTTWRFKLRQGVTFHDGEPFNGETAAKAVNRVVATKLDCHSRLEYFGKVDAKATAVDASTIDIVTAIPEPILPTFMTWVMLVSPNTPMDKLAQTAVGTGAYAFEKYTPGQEILMKRNDKYWGAKPQAETVRFVWRNESSVRAAMIKIGEADLTDNIAAQDVDKTATTYRDISYPNAETAFLRIDAMIPPFDDKRLRLALNLAVDRESLRGTVFPKEVLPTANLVMPGIAGHNPALKPWPYDLAKAKQLFAEAKAAGAPVDKEITLYGRGNLYPNSQESMEALLAMWTQLGFKMKIVMLESANWSKLHGKPFAADRGPSIIQTRHNNQTGDAVFTAESKWGCEGRFSVVCDPALDKLIAEATQMPIGPERAKKFQEVFRIAHEDKIVDVAQFNLVGYVRVGPRINYAPTPLTNNSLEIATVTFK